MSLITNKLSVDHQNKGKNEKNDENIAPIINYQQESHLNEEKNIKIEPSRIFVAVVRVKKLSTAEINEIIKIEDDSTSEDENSSLKSSSESENKSLKSPKRSLYSKNNSLKSPLVSETAVDYQQFPKSQSQSKDGSIKCPKCSKKYKKMHFLAKHMKIHNKEFFCKKCGRKFNSEKNKNRHKCTKCKICNVSFANAKDLMQHKSKVHYFFQNSNDKHRNGFKCTACGKICKSKQGLTHHFMENHSKHEKKYLCDKCPKKFRSKESIRYHIEDHIKTKCHICDKDVISHHINDHIMAVHSDEKKFKCPKCPAAFRGPTYLRKHLNAHNKKFHCNLCDKKFSENCELKNHLKWHENPDIWKCKICRKSFSEPTNFYRHRKVHDKTAPKKFKCDLCEYSVNDSSTLRSHKEYHKKLDEKAKKFLKVFKCVKCPSVFDKGYHLKGHVKSCHSSIRYSCDKCGYLFKQKINVTKHFINVHKIDLN